MGPLQRRLLKAVLAIVERPKLTLVVCGLALAGCIVYALICLKVNTDEDALFSPNVGFFQEYLKFENKFPENEALYVIIEPADVKSNPGLGRWTSVADAVVDRLRGLKGYVLSADAGVRPKDLGAQGILYDDPESVRENFEQAKQLAGTVRLWFLSRLPIERVVAGTVGNSRDPDAAQFVTRLADSWKNSLSGPDVKAPDLASIGADTPADLGYDYETDQTDSANHMLVVQVHLTDLGSDSTVSDEQQLDAVRVAVGEVGRGYPEFRVGVTGRPALDADEMRTSDIDSTKAEIVALIVVFIGLAATLRSIWMAVCAEIALAVGIGWTFGWATASVGELNLLSLVFLITLIGIGMDYLIQILTRYRREARRYERPAAIWARVFRYVSPPICTACLGAAGAFFVSVFTDFRGAAQLGVIAGGGLLLCLLAGYTVLPALLVLFPPALSRVDPDARYVAFRPHGRVKRLIPPAAWVMLLAVLAAYVPKAQFNPNLLDLQAQNLESVKLVHKLQTWSAVAMSKDLSALREVRDAVARSPLVGSTDSALGAWDNYLWLKNHQDEMPVVDKGDPAPVTVADLAGIASAAESMGAGDFARTLRATPAAVAAERLTRWQNAFAEQVRQTLGRFRPPPPEMGALPDELRHHLVSEDGYYALYIIPKENLWKREPLARFVKDVEFRAGQVAGAPSITGIAPEIYHSTQSIQKSFYKATTLALILVFVLVLLDLRNLGQTFVTVSVLALGLPVLAGLMGLLGISWNFANFFGLPILIGAGHEYGVFMMHRYREAQHDPRRVWGSWDVSDRALLLCGFVTTSSFAFFWALGHHEGLKSLGLVMALGTACIYLAAVLVVRPLLKWKIEVDAAKTRDAGPDGFPVVSDAAPMVNSPPS